MRQSKEQNRLFVGLNNGFDTTNVVNVDIDKAERIANKRQQKSVKKTSFSKVATPHKLDNVIRKHIGAQMYETDILHGKKETAKSKFFARKK